MSDTVVPTIRSTPAYDALREVQQKAPLSPAELQGTTVSGTRVMRVVAGKSVPHAELPAPCLEGGLQ